VPLVLYCVGSPDSRVQIGQLRCNSEGDHIDSRPTTLVRILWGIEDHRESLQLLYPDLTGSAERKIETLSHDLRDAIEKLTEIVRLRTAMTNVLYRVILEDPLVTSIRPKEWSIPQPIYQTLPLLLHAAATSSRTVCDLGPGVQTRDCYCIARTVLETCVNASYILAKGPLAAERAIRHCRQKAFKDMDRESKIGATIIKAWFSGKPDFTTVPQLEADIAEFSSKHGREKNWIDDSIDDRIVVIGEEFGNSVLTRLHFARFMIYRHSSEILHGSVFGAGYFLGLTTPGLAEGVQGATENIGSQHMMVLFAVALSLQAVIECFHLRYGFEKLQEENERLSHSMRSISYFKPNGLAS
jgi:hypothetical protein